MGHSRKLRLVAILALGATAAVTLAAAASAGQIFRETFHDEETLVFEDFCNVSGLTVEFAIVRDGRFHAVPHGPDGLAYLAPTSCRPRW
jgi:hypothetical protein